MAIYTSVTKVRHEAGFDGNTNIVDSEILDVINEVHGQILSRLSSKYDISFLDVSNSNFAGSPANYKLAGIEKLWAAGQLLVTEYGPEGTEQKDKGYQKINKARKDLEMLFSDPPERLIGNDNEEFATVAISGAGEIVSTGMDGIDNRITHDQKF